MATTVERGGGHELYSGHWRPLLIAYLCNRQQYSTLAWPSNNADVQPNSILKLRTFPDNYMVL
jgi:hypothetical protein